MERVRRLSEYLNKGDKGTKEYEEQEGDQSKPERRG